jgi:hypothetical protein
VFQLQPNPAKNPQFGFAIRGQSASHSIFHSPIIINHSTESFDQAIGT